MSFFLIIKLYALAGLLIGLREMCREISQLHRALLHPYGLTWRQRWIHTLAQLNWWILPFYISVYLLFWPYAMFENKRGR